MTGMTIVRLIDNIVPEENFYREEYGENMTNQKDGPKADAGFPRLVIG